MGKRKSRPFKKSSIRKASTRHDVMVERFTNTLDGGAVSQARKNFTPHQRLMYWARHELLSQKQRASTRDRQRQYQNAIDIICPMLGDLRDVHSINQILKWMQTAGMMLIDFYQSKKNPNIVEIYNNLVVRLQSLRDTTNGTFAVGNLHPRHIIPYSDIRGIVLVALSPDGAQLEQQAEFAKKKISELIDIFKDREDSEYTRNLGGQWQLICAHQGNGLQGIYDQVQDFVNCLANCSLNIFLGDGQANVAICNSLDINEQAVFTHSERMVYTLAAWWKSAMGGLDLNPQMEDTNDGYTLIHSDVSRSMQGRSNLSHDEMDPFPGVADQVFYLD